MRQSLLALLGTALLMFVACSSNDTGNNELSEELAETIGGAEVYRFGSPDKANNEWVVVYRNRTAQKIIYGILVNPETSLPQGFSQNTAQRPRLVEDYQPQGQMLGAGRATQVSEYNLDNGQTRLEVTVGGVVIKVIGDKIQMGGGGGFDKFGGSGGNSDFGGTTGGGDFGGGSGW